MMDGATREGARPAQAGDDTAPAAIRARGLTRRFGDLMAVDGISERVARQIYGHFHENG